MKLSKPVLALGVPALLAAVGAVGADAAVQGHQASGPALPPIQNTISGTAPASAARIATPVTYFAGDLLAMGYKPVCGGAAANEPAGLNTADWALATADGVQAIPGSQAGEALAACHPDEIFDISPDHATIGATESAIAPTTFVQIANPPLDTAGEPVSTWQDWLWNLAEAVGGDAPNRARVVIAKLDRRAAAIRGQVAGKTFATVGTYTSSSFYVSATYLPNTSELSEDLGLVNYQLPSNLYPSSSPCGGTNVGNPPSATCNAGSVTAQLSDEELKDLNPVDYLFLLYANTVSDVDVFASNPLFEAIPAVKDHHWAEGFDLGYDPLGVGLTYSAVEKAAGLKEYSTTLKGSVGASADITLDPASGKACWSISPTPGKGRPSGPITLTSTASKQSVKLASTPKYTNPDSAAPGVAEWQTSPITWEANGCQKVPASFVHAWTAHPSSVSVRYAKASASLTAGAPSPVYTSAS